MKPQKAIIVGGGPAGLTAAYELLSKSDIIPIIYEEDSQVGGLSKTIDYKGNKIDIGGHRFFSKSDIIMDWWKNILPTQGAPSKDDLILNNKNAVLSENGPDPEKTEKVILVRNRLSRIFFLKKFFDYPVKLNVNTISNLGFLRIATIGISYVKIKLFPIKTEKSLEDFFINRFGKELFLTFFKDYTEKLWGFPCNKIKPEWGAQRVKGLSITKALIHIIKNKFRKHSVDNQKKVETSLIEQFLYPKFGPGQMWSEVAKIIQEKGGKIFLNHEAVGINSKKNRLTEITIKNKISGKIIVDSGDYFFSTMPVKDLIRSFSPKPPKRVLETANGLIYRDFITVGLLLKKMKIENKTGTKTINNTVPDNWIYIQEREVKLGRLQIFNNWSPYMVKNINTVWVGLEYFCSEGDDLWNRSEKDFLNFAIDELASIDIIEKKDILDKTVIKIKKAYPAYFGSYDDFSIIREFVDKFENLFLIGRNGMHRYNNQDHSMLTAMKAVENIINNTTSKSNIWNINTEKKYNERKT